MVYALEEIRRLLKPGGILVDIHPVPEGSLTEVRQGESVLYSERTLETSSNSVILAEKALAQVVEQGFFKIDKHAWFDFFTYADSAEELSAYWEEQEAFDIRSDDDPQAVRERMLYAQAEEIMKASREGALAVTHERAGITRLRALE